MFALSSFLESPAVFVSGGLFDNPEACSWRHPARVIDSYEVILVRTGTLYMEEGGTGYTVKANEVLFLRPGVAHRGTADCLPPPSFYWLHFRFPGQDPTLVGRQLVRPPDANPLLVLARQLLHYADTPRYPRACADHVMNLFLTEALLTEAEEAAAGQLAAKQVHAWIGRHYDQPLTLESIAARFGYNPDYLTRLFRARYQMGIKQYLDKVRMDKAKELLLSGLYTLKEIPPRIGVDSYAHFLKMFKYHEGITPTQYRALYSNIHINIR